MRAQWAAPGELGGELRGGEINGNARNSSIFYRGARVKIDASRAGALSGDARRRLGLPAFSQAEIDRIKPFYGRTQMQRALDHAENYGRPTRIAPNWAWRPEKVSS